MSIHRIPLIAQKVSEALSKSLRAYQIPNHALEDINFIWGEYKVTVQDKAEIFYFMYVSDPDPTITIGEIQFMMTVCAVPTLTIHRRV